LNFQEQATPFATPISNTKATMKQIYDKSMLNRIRSKIKQKSLAGLPVAIVRRLIGSKDQLQKEGDQSPNINQDPLPTLETPEYIVFQETPQKSLRR
jgi:hypothetical protein